LRSTNPKTKRKKKASRSVSFIMRDMTTVLSSSVKTCVRDRSKKSSPSLKEETNDMDSHPKKKERTQNRGGQLARASIPGGNESVYGIGK